MNESLVANVSDTARWVATYRAWESARPDALFHDPFAERLAGERGRAMARHMPRQARNGWPLIARTVLIDELILASIAEGCDCVVNLAAGLDTRPYRMALPESLTWIEVDLPAMIDEKERLLADAAPVCQLVRRRVDLSEASARAALFDELADMGATVLVITEGLLIYLDERVVTALAQELAACRGVRWWIFDLTSPSVLKYMRRATGSFLENSPMIFGPANGVAFFEAFGWVVREIRSMLHEAARLQRLPLLLRLAARLPTPDPRRLGRARWSAVIRLAK